MALNSFSPNTVIESTKVNANFSGLAAGTEITAGVIQPAHLVSASGTSWVWQSWTPTWVNLTIGNGTNDAKYVQVGKTVFYRLLTTFGSTSNLTGAATFTLPVTSIATPNAKMPIGVVIYNRNASSSTSGFVGWASTTTGALWLTDINTDVSVTSSTTPFNPSAVSYLIMISGQYEVA